MISLLWMLQALGFLAGSILVGAYSIGCALWASQPRLFEPRTPKAILLVPWMHFTTLWVFEPTRHDWCGNQWSLQFQNKKYWTNASGGYNYCHHCRVAVKHEHLRPGWRATSIHRQKYHREEIGWLRALAAKEHCPVRLAI